MATRFYKERFDGYTHRFRVEFMLINSEVVGMDIYTNTDSYEEVEESIKQNISKNVVSFNIVLRASKVEDEKFVSLLNN